jgi:hypothetical protein
VRPAPPCQVERLTQAGIQLRRFLPRFAPFFDDRIAIIGCHHILERWKVVPRAIGKRFGDPRTCSYSATLRVIDSVHSRFAHSQTNSTSPAPSATSLTRSLISRHSDWFLAAFAAPTPPSDSRALRTLLLQASRAVLPSEKRL